MLAMKKYLPTRDQIRETRGLKFLGDRILEPNLWHFNRHSLSFAFLIGGFWSFFPIPFQSIPCVLLCIWLRCNVPVAIAVVWVSNPITMSPMMYFAYLVGSWLMGTPQQATPNDPTFEWFMEQLANIWQPLFLGALVCGAVTGITGFLAVRIYYRWRITRYKQRKLRKRKRGEITPI
ncbi:MAG: DUF2062 domain-containing protein [Pseudomonadales bacterium]|jgi:uncharacterized protein (DUF2062 family)|nr:DUF2062 domain-containing protein [Pseudomonadales bacterium]